MINKFISIYIHWPFCKIKCPYCDFNSYKRTSINQEEWLKGYLKSIDGWADLFNEKIIVKSLFFGGGTPSLIKPDIVGKILDRIWLYWEKADDCEITIEANPNSISKNRLMFLKKFDVNRISVGIQALKDKDLKLLGRDHNLNQALKAIEIVQNIFSNFNLDFIYGRQHQSKADWQKELSKILTIGSPHLSLYQLTIEEKTLFYKLQGLGRLDGMPSENLNSDLFLLTRQLCNENNYINYETSNYTRNGYFCKHNLSYWKYKDYLGIGPGAHGRITIDDQKYASLEISNPDNWLKKHLKEKVSLPSLSRLSQKTQFEEKLIMNLRISEEISISFFDVKKLEKKLGDLIEYNLLKVKNEKIILKEKGKRMLNYISKVLLDCY